MISNRSSSNKTALFILSYFILWIVLFEFILPVNNILPRPSVVLLAFAALWNSYHLLANVLTSVSAVYLSLIVAYFAVQELSRFLILRRHYLGDFIDSLHVFSKYLPGILIGFFLIYWFRGEMFADFIFAFAASFFSIVIKFEEVSRHAKSEYVDAAVSLGAGKSIVARRIVWKSSQPELIKHIYGLHLYLWSFLIVFEYISGGYGLGSVFRYALDYKDLSALFAACLITGVIIFAGTQIIKYFKNKFLHWSAE